MADPKRPQLVLVVWEDATVLDDDRWAATVEKPEYKPAIIHTVGFLLHESKQGVHIAGSWCPDHTSPRDQIPRGMIHKIVRLKG